jgi:hypothetical protein
VANVLDISLSRSLTVAKGIVVTARSPSLTRKQPVIQSYPKRVKAIQAGQATVFGGAQTYHFTLPAGKTPVEVEQFAAARHAEIVRHAMQLRANMPGDNDLSTKRMLRLTGTGTAWDQDYFVVDIQRRMDDSEGYRMQVSARNSTPESLQ